MYTIEDVPKADETTDVLYKVVPGGKIFTTRAAAEGYIKALKKQLPTLEEMLAETKTTQNLTQDLK